MYDHANREAIFCDNGVGLGLPRQPITSAGVNWMGAKSQAPTSMAGLLHQKQALSQLQSQLSGQLYNQGLAGLGAAGGSFPTSTQRGPFFIHGDYATADLPTETAFGEIEAYRVWRVTPDEHLKSASAEIMWFPGIPMHANSSREYGGGSDNWITSDLGIHAFKAPYEALKYAAGNGSPWAYGKVKMWGTVIEHDLGYRAEYASVFSLTGILGVFAGDRLVLLDRLRQIYQTDQYAQANRQSGSSGEAGEIWKPEGGGVGSNI